jgi:uncharacterized protein YggE
MKTNGILLLSLFLGTWLSACHNHSLPHNEAELIQEGGLQVSGMGEMRVLPDLMETHMYIHSEARDFKTTVTNMRRQTDQIVAHLKENGHQENAIVTLRMSITKQYDYRSGRRIDKGYLATQSVKLTSDYTADKLGDVVDMMGKSPVDVPFSFGFTLKDESRQKFREELMKMAVEDARSKASVLAGAGGLNLSGIRRISYGYPAGERPPVLMYDAMARNEAVAQAESSVNLQVDEMTLTESVDVLWGLSE